MLTIPTKARHIKNIASTDATRYAIQCVRITATETGGEVVATDGKKLLKYRFGKPAAHPLVTDALSGAPNTAKSAMLLAEDFSSELRMKKDGIAALSLGEQVVTFSKMEKGASSPRTSGIKTEESNFPKYESTLELGNPEYSILLSPNHLRALADTIEHMGAESMKMEFFATDKPVRITAETGEMVKLSKYSDAVFEKDGGTITALLMPMVGGDHE